jgi:predicted DNA-binding transcriptional regulator YafY
MKLYNTVKSLILEVASVDSIVNAIKNKDKIIIYYDGDEPGGRGLREIEPVCFGYSKADNPVLRAWDMEGASHTAYKGEQPLPGWRLFRADKILSFKPTGEKFTDMKPGYNPNGDRSMNRVIINAVFGSTPTSSPNSQIITSVVNQMLQDIARRGIQGADLTKAAETYKRVYSAIESQTGRRLSDIDKQSLRPQIVTIINQLQNK